MLYDCWDNSDNLGEVTTWNIISLKLLLSTNGRVQVVLYVSLKDGEQCNSRRNLIMYYLTETDITHMDDFLFFIFPPIFKKVVKWGSGSFEFYLLVRVILHECHSIRGHSRDVTQ